MLVPACKGFAISNQLLRLCNTCKNRVAYNIFATALFFKFL